MTLKVVFSIERKVLSFLKAAPLLQKEQKGRIGRCRAHGAKKYESKELAESGPVALRRRKRLIKEAETNY
jgi:hypothetical protein